MRMPRLAIAAHEGQRLLARRRGRDALAARHDQGRDRAGRSQTPRQHLDAGRAAHRPRRHRQHLDRGRGAGKARGDLEHRNRAGGIEQLKVRKDQHADHVAVSCPEMREIWHFGQEAIMAGCSGQVKSRRVHDVRAASDRSCAVSARDPARFHRPAAGVFQHSRRQGAPDLEAHRAGAERFRAGADARPSPSPIARSSTSSACPAASAPTTWSMTRRCWPSCASRRKAPNTSPRSARDRWCWARPAC